MKNILLIALKVKKAGGVQTRIVNYCKHLRDFGFNPIVLSVEKYEKLRKTKYFGAVLYEYPKERRLQFPFFLSSIVKRHKIDAFHILEGCNSVTSLSALIYAKLKGIDNGISIYGGETKEINEMPFFANKKFKFFEKFKIKIALALADRIAVNSKSTLNCFVPEKSHPKTKFVYPGVNMDLLQYKNETVGRKNNILTVGRIIVRKGVDDLVKALKIVLKKYPDATLTICGDVEKNYLSYLKELIKNLNIEENVEFTGEITDLKKLSELYSSCSVFCLPPKTIKGQGAESFGLVYLEANAFKKPVIGTRHFGIPEAVIVGKNGLLVGENNPEAMAKAIATLFENPKLRKRLGKNGFNRVLNEFKDVDSTRQLVELYEGKII